MISRLLLFGALCRTILGGGASSVLGTGNSGGIDLETRREKAENDEDDGAGDASYETGSPKKDVQGLHTILEVPEFL